MKGTGRKFQWLYLIVAIIAVTAFAQANPKWGKWIFALAVVSALLLASNTVLNTVGDGVKT